MPFGFSFGGGTKNSTSSFTGQDDYTKNFNQTSTPTNPDWVTNGAHDIFGNTQALAGRDPSSYVAGPNPLQMTAYGSSMGLNNGDSLFRAGTDELGHIMNGNAPQVGQAATASPYVQQYMDPYLHDVVDATTADLNANDAQTRARQSLDLAKSGALGGSRAAIAQGITEGELERARATTLGGLRQQGYSQALSAANADAQRSESAKELNANLRDQNISRAAAIAQALPGMVTNYDANARANIENQAGIGGQIQGIQQKQAEAPLDLASWLTQNFSGLPLSLFQGQTQTGTENGTETQSGTQKGKQTGFNFGFSGGGGGS